MTYIPDIDTARRLASAILRDQTRDIDFTTISEALADEPTAADLNEQDYDVMLRAVDTAVRDASVHITWPAFAA